MVAWHIFTTDLVEGGKLLLYQLIISPK